MSSTLPWGKSFREHRASYKKWDRYKKDLEDKMREITKLELLGFFIHQQVSTGPSVENAISGGSGQVLPNLLLAQIGTDYFLFVCSATNNRLAVCYVDITCVRLSEIIGGTGRILKT
jgi:hypothetical protein